LRDAIQCPREPESYKQTVSLFDGLDPTLVVAVLGWDLLAAELGVSVASEMRALADAVCAEQVERVIELH